MLKRGRVPTLENFAKIAKACGLPMTAFFTEEEPQAYGQHAAYEPAFAAPSAHEHVYAAETYQQPAPQPARAIDDPVLQP